MQLTVFSLATQYFLQCTKWALMWHWEGSELGISSCSLAPSCLVSATLLLPMVKSKRSAGWVIFCMSSPPQLLVNSSSLLAAAGDLISVCGLLLRYLVTQHHSAISAASPCPRFLQVSLCHPPVLSCFLGFWSLIHPGR